MTFFDGWRALNTCLDAGDLTAPTQLVAYKLFAIFNERRFPESLPVSDRELLSRTNLKSTKTIFEARRQLKNAGIFDFTAEAGKTTRYKFGKQLINSSETVGKQLVNSSETPAPNPNIHARDKTEDLKTKDITTSATARTRAPVNYDIDRLVERWESSEAFGKIDMLIVAKLTALLKNYSVDEILTAMDKAILGNDNRRGINYNYFEAILKGGDKRAKTRVNRSNVLAFAANSTGKGRFDDDPEYN